MKFEKSLILILLVAFTVRLFPLGFPEFTNDEVRTAIRGYNISQTSKDELGRPLPFVFNSLNDYQLPVVSYLTTSGVLIFGKNDLGVRIPFIILGTLLVLLTYTTAKTFNSNKSFQSISALLVALSPPLIFLSKVPNETIVLVVLLTLLFYLLVNGKSLFIIITTVMLLVFTSKIAWLLLLPFITLILFVFKPGSRKNRFVLLGIVGMLLISTFIIFLGIPQAKRSLVENNFNLFSDASIKNGIDKIRGQGMESGWPAILDRLLFNKLFYPVVGIMHWISHFNPALYFGQFDSSGLLNYSRVGIWAKILLVPLLLGLIYTIKQKGNKAIWIIFLVLMFPSLFIYPNMSLELVVLTIPFMAIIIAFGVKMINSKLLLIFLGAFTILELAVNIYNFSPEYKNTNNVRPGWIKTVVSDTYQSSKGISTAVSDDLVSDIVPFIGWYTDAGKENKEFGIQWPYKFKLYNISAITIIPSDGKFRSCGKDESANLFLSKRDLQKVREFKIEVVKSYKDHLGETRVSLISKNICLN